MRLIYRILIIITIVIIAGGFLFIKLCVPGIIEIDVKQVRTSIKNDSLYATILLENGALSFFTRYTESIKFKVTLDTHNVAQGTIDYTEKTDSLNYVLIPGYLSIKDMQSVIEAEGDSVWITIHTEISKRLPLFGIQLWKGEKSIRIVRPRPPEFRQTRITGFAMDKDTIRFILEGYLNNYNPIAITLLETALEMEIDNRFNAHVAIPIDLKIPPTDSVFVQANIEIQDFKLLKDGLAILFSTEALPYVVSGAIVMQLDSVEILEPIEMDILHTGNISLSPFKKDN